MTVTTLKSELERAENDLRASFDTGGNYDRQKQIEAEIRELKDRLFHEQVSEMVKQETELQQHIEDEFKRAEELQGLMTSLADDIDEKMQEVEALRQTHASWSAQKYVAEVNARNAKTTIRELKKHRSIKVSERLADAKIGG